MNYSYYSEPLSSEELYHHGILGQKWGVRRYQYENGSYTPEGAKRYIKTSGDYQKAKAERKEANREMWKHPTNADAISSFYTASARARQAKREKNQAAREFKKNRKNAINAQIKKEHDRYLDAKEAYKRENRESLKSPLNGKQNLERHFAYRRMNKARRAERKARRALSGISNYSLAELEAKRRG